jgi:hypothetical protein
LLDRKIGRLHSAPNLVDISGGAAEEVMEIHAIGDEAEAQGLPYVFMPRELSQEEWIEKYCPAGEREKK